MINSHFAKYSVYTLLLFATLAFLSGCSKTPEETLKSIAESTQKTCPQVIDEHTSLISVEYLPNRKLKYTYLAATKLSDEEKKMLAAGMKTVLLDVLKKQPELEFYQANDVSFEHVFANRDKQIVVQVNIEPVDYK